MDFENQTDIIILLENIKCRTGDNANQRQGFVALAEILNLKDECQDFFREAGGVEEIKTKLLTGEYDVSMIPVALFCLACAVKDNVTSKMDALSEDLFLFLHQLFSSQVNQECFQSAAFFLACLVSGNVKGQHLANETGCMGYLLLILRKLIQNKHMDKKQWMTMTRSLCACISNPQNENNQRISSCLIPDVMRVISNWSDESIIQHGLSMIGQVMHNNVPNQRQFRSCGGIDVLSGLITNVVASIDQDSTGYDVLIAAITTMDFAVTDNQPNAAHALSLGFVPQVLSLFHHNQLRTGDMMFPLMALAHVMEHTDLSLDSTVMTQCQQLMIQILTDTESSQDDEILSIIKYILAICKEKDGGKRQRHALRMNNHPNRSNGFGQGEIPQPAFNSFSKSVSSENDILCEKTAYNLRSTKNRKNANDMYNVVTVSDRLSHRENEQRLNSLNSGLVRSLSGRGKRLASQSVEYDDNFEMFYGKRVSHDGKECSSQTENFNQYRKHSSFGKPDDDKDVNDGFEHRPSTPQSLNTGLGEMQNFFSGIRGDNSEATKLLTVMALQEKQMEMFSQTQNMISAMFPANSDKITPTPLQQHLTEAGSGHSLYHSQTKSLPPDPQPPSTQPPFTSTYLEIDQMEEDGESDKEIEAGGLLKGNVQNVTRISSAAKCDASRGRLNKDEGKQQQKQGDNSDTTKLMAVMALQEKQIQMVSQTQNMISAMFPAHTDNTTITPKQYQLTKESGGHSLYHSQLPPHSNPSLLQPSFTSSHSQYKQMEEDEESEEETVVGKQPKTNVRNVSRISIAAKCKTPKGRFSTDDEGRPQNQSSVHCHELMNDERVGSYKTNHLKSKVPGSVRSISPCNILSACNSDHIDTECKKAKESSFKPKTSKYSTVNDNNSQIGMDDTTHDDSRNGGCLNSGAQTILSISTVDYTQSPQSDTDSPIETHTFDCTPRHRTPSNHDTSGQGKKKDDSFDPKLCQDKRSFKKHLEHDLSCSSTSRHRHPNKERNHNKQSHKIHEQNDNQILSNTQTVSQNTRKVKAIPSIQVTTQADVVREKSHSSPAFLRPSSKRLKNRTPRKNSSLQESFESALKALMISSDGKDLPKWKTDESNNKGNSSTQDGMKHLFVPSPFRFKRQPLVETMKKINERMFSLHCASSGSKKPLQEETTKSESEVKEVESKILKGKKREVTNIEAASRSGSRVKEEQDVYCFRSESEQVAGPSSPDLDISMESLQRSLRKRNQTPNGSCQNTRRSRVPYTDQEVLNLRHGVATLGTRWHQIVAVYEFHPSRTAVDLKEKFKRLMEPSKTKCDKIGKKDETLPFSSDEIKLLKRGVKMFGHNWKAILAGERFLPGRTPQDLRNKWRSLSRVIFSHQTD